MRNLFYVKIVKQKCLIFLGKGGFSRSDAKLNSLWAYIREGLFSEGYLRLRFGGGGGSLFLGELVLFYLFIYLFFFFGGGVGGLLSESYGIFPSLKNPICEYRIFFLSSPLSTHIFLFSFIYSESILHNCMMQLNACVNEHTHLTASRSHVGVEYYQSK